MKRAATVAITALALTGVSTAALAAWSSIGSGAGSAQSDSKPSTTPAAPTTSVSGTTVTINFSAITTVTEAQPASTYVMTRYTALSGGTAAGTFTCTRPTPCTDERAEGSTTHYTYTPKWGNGWTGVESSRSAAAVVPAAEPAPAAADVQATPGGRAANNGKPTQLDVITLTFNKVVTPASIMPGFTGAATPVTTNFDDNGTNDDISFSSTTLGAVKSGGEYVSNNGQRYSFASTMTMATVGGRSVVTITLGVVSHATRPLVVSGTPTMSWATTSGVKDANGTAATTGSATESGSADADF